MFSKTLEQAYESAKSLPLDRQDQLGEWLREFIEQENSDARLTPEQNAEVARRMADPNPVFATDEQLKLVLDRYSFE